MENATIISNSHILYMIMTKVFPYICISMILTIYLCSFEMKFVLGFPLMNSLMSYTVSPCYDIIIDVAEASFAITSTHSIVTNPVMIDY